LKRILSTKKLSTSQRDLLTGAGFSVVSYDAITPFSLQFELPEKLEHIIFTSRNGAKSVLSKLGSLSGITNIYCVGKKTADYCKENNGNVVFFAQNGAELAQYLIKSQENREYIYFCSAQRRDELPQALKEAKIDVFEVKTYDISSNLLVFDQKWAGILFFSPSGVQAYFDKNAADKAGIAFCIGPTTASEASKFINKVVISNSPTTESLIAKAVKTLQND